MILDSSYPSTLVLPFQVLSVDKECAFAFLVILVGLEPCYATFPAFFIESNLHLLTISFASLLVLISA